MQNVTHNINKFNSTTNFRIIPPVDLVDEIEKIQFIATIKAGYTRYVEESLIDNTLPESFHGYLLKNKIDHKTF